MTIQCANCGQRQEDEGKGATCLECGASPLPSYAYPVDSPFRPLPPKAPILAPSRSRTTALPKRPAV